MDFEQRLSAILHDVADADPPANLVERALGHLPAGKQGRSHFAPPVAMAAAIAALVLIAGAVATMWRPVSMPPAAEPSPSVVERAPTPAPSPFQSPRECPGSQIVGTLAAVSDSELALDPAVGFEASPTDRTPLVWEPYFRLGDDGGSVVVRDPDGDVVARDGDIVEIGGGERDGGWYACGYIEVLSSGGPLPAPVLDLSERSSWRALMTIERGVSDGPIGPIRRIEWIGDTLHLEIAARHDGVVDQVRAALSGATDDATVASDPDGLVTIEIPDARTTFAPSIEPRCGAWQRVTLLPIGDGKELRGEDMARAGEVLRLRAAEALGLDGQDIVLHTEDGRHIIVELPAGPDSSALNRARQRMQAPAPAGLMAVPDGVAVQAGDSADSMERGLVGAAAIDVAVPAVDIMGQPALHLTLHPDAAEALDEFAAERVGGQVALVVGDVVVAAAMLNAPRFGGELEIVGPLRVADVAPLADRLSLSVDSLEFELVDVSTAERDC
ncbi:MAG TPA: hypothetical protein VM305_10360 [Candidatus Limnocylindrales bacterium]|nr:hypothetical protein [Candidatus Limnocylindrales bacterium]